MENLLTALSQQFQTKGFVPVEIQGLLKDVSSLFDGSGACTLPELNRELEDLGWGIEIMDTVTYELLATKIPAAMPGGKRLPFEKAENS